MIGVCSVCKKETRAPHACLSCGATLCAEHYDFSSGFCPSCKIRLRKIERG